MQYQINSSATRFIILSIIRLAIATKPVVRRLGEYLTDLEVDVFKARQKVMAIYKHMEQLDDEMR